MSGVSFPSFEDILGAYDRDAKLRDHVEHNLKLWKWIQGGLALVTRSPLAFDPRSDYWYQTERRLLVTYFHERFRDAYSPPASLRELAFGTFSHFETARAAGRLGPIQLARAETLASLLDRFQEIANELPEFPGFAVLRARWPRRTKAADFKTDLLALVNEARQAEYLDSIEATFYRRLVWFPYLGLPSLTQLLDRQRFFSGFYALFASTNSYSVGGGMSFAPILQNNPASELVSFAQSWAKGATPAETGFSVNGKDEKRDCSRHAPVVELYGFLNLHRMPFHNSVTKSSYELFAKEGDKSVFDRLARIGTKTRAFLVSSAAAPGLAARFRDLASRPVESLAIQMEGVSGAPGAAEDEKPRLADHRIMEDVSDVARQRSASMSEEEAASALLHLMLDSYIYVARSEPPPAPSASNPKRPVLTVDPSPLEESALPPYGPVLMLPLALQSVAADALGYLRAGYHVLFAGPPGTGKTTAAQFVGHAWNRGMTTVPTQISTSEAPVTTVGNSAWAPFHTVGGMVPDGKGGYSAHKGIFIDPASDAVGTWRLRASSLVLDEMNRADLDRCIGELYPLLTQSVERVSPAGIPGVECITLSEKFRLVATVNDATIDDIVFPISEGLARRFVRLELSGASRQDLSDFMSSGVPSDPGRGEATKALLDKLFDIATELKWGRDTDQEFRIPLGVGYFAPVRAWLRGDLRLSAETEELEPKDQAFRTLRTSFAAAARTRSAAEVIRALEGWVRQTA